MIRQKEIFFNVNLFNCVFQDLWRLTLSQLIPVAYLLSSSTASLTNLFVKATSCLCSMGGWGARGDVMVPLTGTGAGAGAEAGAESGGRGRGSWVRGRSKIRCRKRSQSFLFVVIQVT